MDVQGRTRQLAPKRMVLDKVSIGPWIPSRNGITTVNITSKAIDGRAGGLKDENLGYIRGKGDLRADSNFARSIGKMGVITFNKELLNPVMRDMLLMYLSIYRYNESGEVLEMRDNLFPLVERYRTYDGYRRLKHISAAIAGTNPWKKVKGSLDTVAWSPTPSKKVFIESSKLKKLLEDATANYRRGGIKGSAVSIEDVGINLAISRPEDFVTGIVPVLPNIFRTGNAYQKKHEYDKSYEAILDAKIRGNSEAFSEAYMSLVKKNPEANLVDDVFSAKKTAFIRGSMYSKVGGQIGRSVVAPNLHRRPDEIGIPKSMAKDISRRMLLTRSDVEGLAKVRQLIEEGKITHIFDDGSKEFVPISKEHIATIGRKSTLLLRELGDGDVALGNRQPSLHKNSMLGFYVYTHEFKCIFIHSAANKGFAADFDGFGR
jgi:hypothetical protein